MQYKINYLLERVKIFNEREVHFDLQGIDQFNRLKFKQPSTLNQSDGAKMQSVTKRMRSMKYRETEITKLKNHSNK